MATSAQSAASLASAGAEASQVAGAAAQPDGAAAPPAPAAEGEADDAGDDDEDDEEEADGPAAAGSALNSKQRKKKKSKAAAKLRKRLGLGAGDGEAAASAAGASSSTSSSQAKSKELPDDVVAHIKQTVAAEQGERAASKVDKKNLAEIMSRLNLEREAMLRSQESKQKGQKALADHKFWKTQPVTKPDDAPLRSAAEEGPIKPNQPPHEVQQEPYPLPKDFEWVSMDIDDPEQLKEIYELLSANYVEDDDASLRFNYSPEFLKWVLKHPGYNKKWHIGVRVSSTRKLVAFISGIPHELRVREQAFHSSEINFLCVHKKLRSKRLTPVLIKEVTRQCHLTGVFQAIYTAGAVIPTPISCSRYYHRTLNAPKLLDIGFAAIPQNMSRERYLQRFALPDDPLIPGLREMREDDLAKVGRLMRRYMRRYDMAPRFSDEEVRHVLLSGRGVDEGGKRVGQVTWTYVVENRETGAITDVCSFYSLPSSVLDSDKHKVLNAAYLFYYATDVPFTTPAPPAEGTSASASANHSPAASSAAPAPRQRAEDLESWQRSSITGLSESEEADERDVPRWDQEDATLKRRLSVRLNALVQDLLILAKKFDFDVVNCLTVMDNQLFLSEQKFGPGDGFLRFYLFNWRVQPIAGGMGNRAGEPELDPVVAHLKATAAASSQSSGGKVSDEQMMRIMERRPRAELGSGNGIVMV